MRSHVAEQEKKLDHVPGGGTSALSLTAKRLAIDGAWSAVY